MDKDILYIKRCLELAEKGKGYVSPNPLVGAVLVKNNKIIGEGFHKKYGEAHAEVEAIKNAKVNVKGATLYCNLEPCCHQKKQTPPCVPLIINAKIKKVVISNRDPNPLVNGKGIKLLTNAGIEVVTGICKNEGEELNKFYFKYAFTGVPYITLKVAQSIDGKISGIKKQVWMTGKEAGKYVHRMRANYDAILVGANTIKVDNPKLNVRNVKGRNPIRIILDGSLSINLNSNVLNTDDNYKTWIVTSKKADKKKVNELLEHGIKIIQLLSNSNMQIELKKILKHIGKQKISSLLVEGGRNILSQFTSKNLFDEITVLYSPILLGKGIDGISSERRMHLKIVETERLGKDLRITYRKLEE